MAKKSDQGVDRRKFLAGVAVAGAAVGTTDAAKAALLPGKAAEARRPSAVRPSAQVAQAELGHPPEWDAPPAPGALKGRPGSDFMVDVIKSLDIDYVATNPASSCRGLHESLINYGGNKKPELLTCMHEESATAMGHGYYKVTGKPLIALCHGTVGLQHATMAIYNAWCDRVPVIVMVGNSVDMATRQPGVPTIHSMQDPGALVRDFTKWDSQPGSLQHFAESLVRAYKFSMTPPCEPVLIAMHEHLQEHEMEGNPTIPKLYMPAFPAGDDNAVREAARMLVAADNPVIVADRVARTEAGMKALVELAETLNATVCDQLGRMNMPNQHPLYRLGNGPVANADVVLGLELTDFWGTVHSRLDNVALTTNSRVKPGTKLISIGVGDLFMHANYQDFERYQAVDLALGADAETTLPSLVEAVKQQITPARRAVIAKRGEDAKKAFAQAQKRMLANAAADAWDASPISSSRLSAELWEVIKNEDWALVSRDRSPSEWPHRLWTFDKHYQFIGGPGGAGIGYGLPAAVGAALAHRDRGRIAINLQNDGDSMYAPGVLWTAAHHRIPILNVMWNNRAYHQEVMHVLRMASWRQRGVTNAHIGTTITDPNIDYAKLAQGLGVEGIGPIDNPNDLAPALKRAMQVVKAGEPVVVDVVAQPR